MKVLRRDIADVQCSNCKGPKVGHRIQDQKTCKFNGIMNQLNFIVEIIKK